MNYEIQQSLAAFDCAGQYFLERPLDPPNALATALITELAAVATAMRASGATQATAFTGFRGGTDERHFAFTLVLDDMRVLSRVAKGVSRSEFPGLRELFRLPRSRSFAHIAAHARAFATNLAENEAIFTARSLPAGFIAAFNAKVTAAEAAVADRNAGIINRAGATAALKIKARRGVAILQELDGILAFALLGDPQSLAAWQTARHIARRARAKKEAPAANTEASRTAPVEVAGTKAAVELRALSQPRSLHGLDSRATRISCRVRSQPSLNIQEPSVDWRERGEAERDSGHHVSPSSLSSGMLYP